MTSIELFHVYTDEKIDQEKLDSIDELKKVLPELGDVYELTVLIDDYTPEIQSLVDYPILTNKNDVLEIFDKNQLKIPCTLYESYLIDNGLQVLTMLQHQDAKKYRRLIEKNQKLPCSLFVIAWYMLRLGILSNKRYSTEKADLVLNVLPIRYKEIDDIVFGVIERSIVLKPYLVKIKSIYFESTNNFRPKI